MVYTIVVHLYAKADEESLKKLVAKLQEASQVYSNDKETLSWYGPFQSGVHIYPLSTSIVHRQCISVTMLDPSKESCLYD